MKCVNVLEKGRQCPGVQKMNLCLRASGIRNRGRNMKSYEYCNCIEGIVVTTISPLGKRELCLCNIFHNWGANQVFFCMEVECASNPTITQEIKNCTGQKKSFDETKSS